MEIPFFKLKLNDDEGTGVDMVGVVQQPANLKPFYTMAEDEKTIVRQVFNEEQMIVTGVMISEGTPIYRFDREIGEHYVLFDAETIKECVLRFHKNQFSKNVNFDHEEDKQFDGMFMFESYIVDPENGVNAPAFLKQNVRKGSWVVSYKVEDRTIWEEVKKRGGFSIEGFFDRVPVRVNHSKSKNNTSGRLINKIDEMKDQLLKFAKLIKDSFEGEEPTNEEMATVATDAGLELNYEGELAVGTTLTVVVDGENVPAPEGAHSLTGELEGVNVVVDADGVVVEIIDEREAPEENNEEPKPEEENHEEVESALAEVAEAMTAQLKAVKDENETLKVALQSAEDLAQSQKEEMETKLAEMFERIEKLEKQPTVEPTKKKFKITEPKSSVPQNPIASNL